MNKNGKTTYWLSGFLALVVLTSSIYIFMPDKVKLKVENTNSKFYVWEDNSWILAATEYVNIYEGSTKMRASSRDVIHQTDGNITTIIRTSKWKDNITTIDTYKFDSSNDDITLFPIEHNVRIFNAKNKILHFEYRDILYEGDTQVIENPFEFGHNMKLEWDNGTYYNKVFQQKTVSDKIIVKYRVITDDFSINIRIFDPPKSYKIEKLQNCNIEFYNVSEQHFYNCVNVEDNLTDCKYYLENGSCEEYSKINFIDYCSFNQIIEKNKTVCEPIGFNISYNSGLFYEIDGECCGYFNESNQIVCKEKIAGICNPICQQTSSNTNIYDEYCMIYDIYDNKIKQKKVGDYNYVKNNQIKFSNMKVKSK